MAMVPLSDLEQARMLLKRKLDIIIAETTGHVDSEDFEYCSGYPIGSGNLHADDYLDTMEVWVSLGMPDFKYGKWAKERRGDYEVREMVVFLYAPSCKLKRGGG